MRRIISAALAVAMIFTLAISAIAADYEPATTVGLYVGDNYNGWGAVSTVDVTGPGTYTLTYEGESRTVLWVIVKNSAGENVSTSLPEGIVIRTTELKIDDTTYTFDGGNNYYDYAVTDQVVDGNTVESKLEMTYYNSFIGVNHIDDVPGTASKVSVTFTVDYSDEYENYDVVIDSVEDLATAIRDQQADQTWLIKSGTYDLTQEYLNYYSSWYEKGQGNWYFPIHENGITITGEDGAVITSSVYTANGAWATQDFVTIWGDNVTIDNVDIIPKLTVNKVIEVMGKNATIKNVDILKNEKATDWDNWSGSIVFNSEDIGEATVENVSLSGWISLNYSTEGTLTAKDVTIDFTDNPYAGYSDPSYGYGWNPGIHSSENHPTVNNENLTIYVDNSIDLNGQIFTETSQPGTTVVLTEDITLDEKLDIDSSNIVLDLNGNTITASEDFSYTDADKNTRTLIDVTGDNVTVKNGTVKTTEDNRNAINLYSAEGTVLENMTIDHSTSNGGAPLIVNSSTATVKGTFTTVTGDNSWYAVNVDTKIDGEDSKLTFDTDSTATFAGTNPLGIVASNSTEYDNDVTIEFAPNVTIESEIEDFVPLATDKESVTVVNPGNAGLAGGSDGNYELSAPEKDKTIRYIYLNEKYHAAIIGGRFLAYPHIDNGTGRCPVCAGEIGVTVNE